jgi:hypothetical protein
VVSVADQNGYSLDLRFECNLQRSEERLEVVVAVKDDGWTQKGLSERNSRMMNCGI